MLAKLQELWLEIPIFDDVCLVFVVDAPYNRLFNQMGSRTPILPVETL